MKNSKGQTALITGDNSGIGYAVAKLIAFLISNKASFITGSG